MANPQRRTPLPPERRHDILERLGPLGSFVVDHASMLRFPIKNPPDLAQQFGAEHTLVIGARRYPVAQVALMMPEDLFPIQSLDDLVDKLERAALKEFHPVDIAEQFRQQPQIGIRLRRDEEYLKWQAERHGARTGGPETPPEPEMDPPIHEEVDPKRAEYIKRLGPLGDLILDVVHNVLFPVQDQPSLAHQFTEEEYLIAGPDEYPLAELALQLPDEIFPMESTEDLVDKLEAAGVAEITPEDLPRLIESVASVGIHLELSEKELRKRAEHFPMETGGPEKSPPGPGREVPTVEDPHPERTKRLERLGPLGGLILELADRVDFPVRNPPELAAQFGEGDRLVLGGQQYPVSELAVRMPEALFPIETLDDLVDKLEERRLDTVSVAELRKMIEPNIGYSSPYSEAQLREMGRQSDMQLGGPAVSPIDPLAGPAIRLPENAFPLKSPEDLLEKLEKIEGGRSSPEQLQNLAQKLRALAGRLEERAEDADE